MRLASGVIATPLGPPPSPLTTIVSAMAVVLVTITLTTPWPSKKFGA